MEVKRIVDPGLHPVGGVAGLCLKVKPSGARSWIYRVRIAGKRRHIGVGGSPDVSLAVARERARAMRSQIDQGEDPIAERQARLDAHRAEQARRLAFADAARQCHMAKADEFRSAKHRQDWIRSLEMHAFPAIGELPVADIELPHVLSVLEPIWRRRTETATRVRQRLESVLTWAKVSGYRDGENPARWSGNLAELLPAPSKIRTVRHQRAIPWRDMPAFMAQLRQRKGMAALALDFLILTAARTGEIRGATWDEIDLVERLWTVPGKRIKAGKAHRVPLSDAAIAVLHEVPRMAESPLVFTAPRGGALSDMTMAAVMKRIGIDATPHGCRSTFKDWARACTNYADEVSELALAHVNNDATRAAYARDELLPQRARMMADWARFCAEGLPSKATVSPIGEARGR